MTRHIQAICISFVIILLTSAAVRAADLSAGATAWYTAWDFEWEGNARVSYEPGFLYGPVLSLVMTPEISMSFVFLYGEFTQTIEGDSYAEEIKLKRFDSDLTLNYRIGEYFKLFAGAKFIGFTWPEGGKHEALGPGAGISSVFPAGGNFFILGYMSMMYLEGNEHGDSSSNYDVSAKEYGGNASLSLAYYIPSASTTVSLGGRFQQIKIDYDDTQGSYAVDNTSRFYGVTLTAVYTFNI